MVLVLAQLSTFWPLLFGTVLFSLAMSTIMPLTETRGDDRREGRGARLWPHAAVGLAQLHRRQHLRRLAARAAGRGRGHLAGGRRCRAHRCRRARPAAPDRARPAEGGDQPAAPAGWRMRWACCGRACSCCSCWRPALVQGAHGMFYTFGVLHWRAQGLDTAWSGMLWGVAIVCEVVLFAYSAAVLRRVGPVQLIMLGCGAAVVRWLLMGFDPPLALLVLLQISHSLTYSGLAHRRDPLHEPRGAGPAGRHGAGALCVGDRRHRPRRGHADRRTAVCELRRDAPTGRWRSSPPWRWPPAWRCGAWLSPTAPARAARRAHPRSVRPSSRSRASSSGPSRSTQSASCASSSAGAMASEVATMQPDHDLEAGARAPRRPAASASVSPPALSSLMLMAS